MDSRETSGYAINGACYFGPCLSDLSRYAVRVKDDKVLIDLGTRYIDRGRP